MAKSFQVIIPARYASTRLPGKPLLDIGGQTMVERVWRRALASGARSVAIATDDERIQRAMRILGATVVMTSPHHPSGTDRLSEVVEQLKLKDQTIVVNVQGDEPLIPPAVIRQTAELLIHHPKAAVATLATPITTAAELTNPNVVKVVVNRHSEALYFSRAPIPWQRDTFGSGNFTPNPQLPHLRHLGIYAYRVGFLRQFARSSATPLEQAESLEQLRVLWLGETIAVGIATQPLPAGVDTAEDLERIRAVVAAAADRPSH